MTAFLSATSGIWAETYICKDNSIYKYTGEKTEISEIKEDSDSISDKSVSLTNTISADTIIIVLEDANISLGGGTAEFYGKLYVYGTFAFSNGATVKEGASITVENGGTLTVNSTLNNSGSITISGTLNATNGITSSGDITVTESGKIDGNVTNNGTLTNSGTINSGNTFINYGTFINKSSGTITVTDNLVNSGTIKNEGNILSNTISNTSKITNSGTITANIKNSGGSLDNKGTLDNSGGTINGNISNSGTLNNEGGTISGKVDGTPAEGTGTEIKDSFTWKGGTSGKENDWNTASNWENGKVPDENASVTISANHNYYPVLNSEITVKNLTIISGASVTGGTGGLTISGKLLNSGTVNLGSVSISSDAELINYNPGTFTATTLEISGGKVTNNSAGSDGISATKLTVTDSSEFSGKIKVGDFSFENAGGKTLTVDGAITVTGNLTLTGTDKDSKLSVSGSGSFDLSAAQTGGKFLEISESGPTITTFTYTAYNSTVSGASAPDGWILISDFIWTGVTSKEWNIESNWSSGQIPESDSTVIIPAGCSNYPELSDDTKIAKLTVKNGASVTTNNATLTISDTTDLSGTLTGNFMATKGFIASGTLTLASGSFSGTMTSLAATLTLSGAKITGDVDASGQTVNVFDNECVINGKLSCKTVNLTASLTIENVDDDAFVCSEDFKIDTDDVNLTITGNINVKNGNGTIEFLNKNDFKHISGKTNNVTVLFDGTEEQNFTPTSTNDQKYNLTVKKNSATLNINPNSDKTNYLSVASYSDSYTADTGDTAYANTTITFYVDTSFDSNPVFKNQGDIVIGETCNQFSLSSKAGTISISKNLTCNSTNFTPYSDFIVGGNFTDNGKFCSDGTTGTITLNGNADQTFTANADSVYKSIVINKNTAGTVTFIGNDLKTKNLTFTKNKDTNSVGNTIFEQNVSTEKITSTDSDGGNINFEANFSCTSDATFETTGILTFGNSASESTFTFGDKNFTHSTNETVIKGTFTSAKFTVSTLNLAGTLTCNDLTADTTSANGNIIASGTVNIESLALNGDLSGTTVKTGSTNLAGTIAGSSVTITALTLNGNSKISVTSGDIEISGAVTSTSHSLEIFGTSTITLGSETTATFLDSATLTINGNKTANLKIHGDNEFSSLLLNQLQTAEFTGGNTYGTLNIDNSEVSNLSEIIFASGKTQKISGKFTAKGTSDAKVTLKSSDTEKWTIDAGVSEDDFDYVIVQNANSETELKLYQTQEHVQDYNVSSPTSQNWFNVSDFYWFGGASTEQTSWNQKENWYYDENQEYIALHSPSTDDTKLNITIKNSENGILILKSDISIKTLTVNSGTTVDFGTTNVTTSGVITNSGKIRMSGSQTITTAENGKTSKADSTIEYYGEISSTLPWGTEYENLVFSENASGTITEKLTVDGTLSIKNSENLPLSLISSENSFATAVSIGSSDTTVGKITLAGNTLKIAADAHATSLDLQSDAELCGDVTTTENQKYKNLTLQTDTKLSTGNSIIFDDGDFELSVKPAPSGTESKLTVNANVEINSPITFEIPVNAAGNFVCGDNVVTFEKDFVEISNKTFTASSTTTTFKANADFSGAEFNSNGGKIYFFNKSGEKEIEFKTCQNQIFNNFYFGGNAKIYLNGNCIFAKLEMNNENGISDFYQTSEFTAEITGGNCKITDQFVLNRVSQTDGIIANCILNTKITECPEIETHSGVALTLNSEISCTTFTHEANNISPTAKIRINGTFNAQEFDHSYHNQAIEVEISEDGNLNVAEYKSTNTGDYQNDSSTAPFTNNGTVTVSKNFSLPASWKITNNGTILADGNTEISGTFDGSGTLKITGDSATSGSITFLAESVQGEILCENASLTLNLDESLSCTELTCKTGNLTIKGNGSLNCTTLTSENSTLEFNSDSTAENFMANATSGEKSIILNADFTVKNKLSLSGSENNLLKLSADTENHGFVLFSDFSDGNYLSIDSRICIKNSEGTVAAYKYTAKNSEPTSGTSDDDFALVINHGWNIKALSELTFVWTGATSSDWTEKSNWDLNIAPVSLSEIIIPDSADSWPILETEAEAESITIGKTENSEAKITLSDKNLKLSATNPLTNYGKIIYKGSGRITDSAGNAINDSEHGTVQYETSANGRISDVKYYNLIVTDGNWTADKIDVVSTLNLAGTLTCNDLTADTTSANGNIIASGTVNIESLALNGDLSGTTVKTGSTNLAGTIAGSSVTITALTLNGNSKISVTSGDIEISGAVTSTSHSLEIFGTSTITLGSETTATFLDSATLTINGNKTANLKIHGDNEFSSLLLNQLQTAEFTGGNTYGTLNIDNSEVSNLSEIIFASGKTQKISGKFTAKGTSDAKVTLKSSDTEKWTIDAGVSEDDFDYVIVQNANSETELKLYQTQEHVQDYNVSSPTSQNWFNVSDFYWFGGASTEQTSWNQKENWYYDENQEYIALHSPSTDDTKLNITIKNSENGILILKSDISIKTLTVNSGTTVDFGTTNVTTSGVITNSGKIRMSGSQTITTAENGKTSKADSTIEYYGEISSTLPWGTEYENLVFSEGSTAENLTQAISVNKLLTIAAGTELSTSGSLKSNSVKISGDESKITNLKAKNIEISENIETDAGQTLKLQSISKSESENFIKIGGNIGNLENQFETLSIFAVDDISTPAVFGEFSVIGEIFTKNLEITAKKINLNEKTFEGNVTLTASDEISINSITSAALKIENDALSALPKIKFGGKIELNDSLKIDFPVLLTSDTEIKIKNGNFTVTDRTSPDANGSIDCENLESLSIEAKDEIFISDSSSTVSERAFGKNGKLSIVTIKSPLNLTSDFEINAENTKIQDTNIKNSESENLKSLKIAGTLQILGEVTNQTEVFISGDIITSENSTLVNNSKIFAGRNFKDNGKYTPFVTDGSSEIQGILIFNGDAEQNFAPNSENQYNVVISQKAAEVLKISGENLNCYSINTYDYLPENSTSELKIQSDINAEKIILGTTEIPENHSLKSSEITVNGKITVEDSVNFDGPVNICDGAGLYINKFTNFNDKVTAKNLTVKSFSENVPAILFAKSFTENSESNIEGNVYLYGENSDENGDNFYSNSENSKIEITGNLVIAKKTENSAVNFKNFVNAKNVVLYSGRISLGKNTKLNAQNDFVLLGNAIDSIDEDNVDYNQKNYKLESAFPDSSVVWPISAENYSGQVVAAENSAIQATNFYANGIQLYSSESKIWYVDVPQIQNNENIYAAAYNSDIKYCVVRCSEDDSTDGSKSRIPAYNCEIDENSRNWEIGEFLIVRANTISDNTIFVVFNKPVKNPTNLLNEGKLQYKDDFENKIPFTGAYFDAECNSPVNSNVVQALEGETDSQGSSLYGLYLKAENTWNTDATGKSSGNQDGWSTDSHGNHKNSVPCLIISPELKSADWGRPLKGKKTRSDGGSGDYEKSPFTNVTDGAGPVLISVRTGQENHNVYDSSIGAQSQKSQDSHNFIEFRYSEPVNAGDSENSENYMPAFDDSNNFVERENIKLTDEFGALKNMENKNSALEFAGLATIQSGIIYTGTEGTPSKYANALYRTDSYSVRLSIAGYTDGIKIYDGKEYKNWNSYIQKAELPRGSVNPDFSAEFITDCAVNLENQEIFNPLAKGDEITVNNEPSTDSDFYKTYGSWDTQAPVFAKVRMSGYSNYEDFEEAVGTGNYGHLEKVEIHILDNPSDDKGSGAKWFSKIGWTNDTTGNKNNLIRIENSSLTDARAADIFGGSRPFAQDDYRTSGGIRTSTVINQQNAFKYVLKENYNGAEPNESFETLETSVSANFFYGDYDNPNSISENSDIPYITLIPSATGLAVDDTMYISYDDTKSFITDLAGNLLKSPDDYIETIDRTAPEFFISVGPVGSKEMFITISKNIAHKNSLIFNEREISQTEYLAYLPYCFEICNHEGKTNDDSELQIDRNVPFKIADEKSNDFHTTFRITLTKEISLQDVINSYIRVIIPSHDENPELFPNFSENGYKSTNSLTTTQEFITLIQDKLGNYMKLYTAHPLSDFAINAITVETAYSNKTDLGFDDEIDIYSKQWAVHDFSANQKTLGTISATSGINISTSIGNEILENDYKISAYFAENPPRSSLSDVYNDVMDDTLRIWLPSVFTSLASSAAPSDFVIHPNDDIAENTEFSLTKEQVGQWKSGSQVSFLFGFDDITIRHFPKLTEAPTTYEPGQSFGTYTGVDSPLYILRLSDTNDIFSLDLWSFILKSTTGQRGGVTILNNVVNPEKGDKTIIKVENPKEGNVNVIVMTIDGNVVSYLNRGNLTQGTHNFVWDGKTKNGKNAARGLYFVRITGNGFDETRKVLIVK